MVGSSTVVVVVVVVLLVVLEDGFFDVVEADWFMVVSRDQMESRL